MINIIKFKMQMFRYYDRMIIKTDVNEICWLVTQVVEKQIKTNNKNILC